MKRFGLPFIYFAFINILLTADPKGEEIARKFFSLKKPVDLYSVITMTLIDQYNTRKLSKFEMYSKNTETGRNMLIVFLESKDETGVKILSIGQKNKNNQHYLYLPGLGKIKNIGPAKEGAVFLGSDLWYYDMEYHTFDEFTYHYITDEIQNGAVSSVIEWYPKDSAAPYTKQKVWIDNDNYFTTKIECYRKDGTVFKTITFEDIKMIDGYLIAFNVTIFNHNTRHQTILRHEFFRFDQGLKDELFDVKNLKENRGITAPIDQSEQ